MDQAKKASLPLTPGRYMVPPLKDGPGAPCNLLSIYAGVMETALYYSWTDESSFLPQFSATPQMGHHFIYGASLKCDPSYMMHRP